MPDIVNKDPRYFFCLKSDDLSTKSWFLAAESEYERKKWMVSLAWHIEKHCRPSVTLVHSGKTFKVHWVEGFFCMYGDLHQKLVFSLNLDYYWRLKMDL